METALAPRSNGGGPMNTIKDMFEAAKGKLAQVAPRHMSPDRMLRVALLTISKTPMLSKCKPASLLGSFMEAGRLGLEIGGALGEAYLVPYQDQATLIVGYRGMISLARRSGQIQSIEAQVVREGDEFIFEYGIETIFKHRPRASLDAPITHAWAIAKFKDGGHQLDVMRIEEIEAIRNRSRAGRSGPWVTDFAEMAKKTVVRRLCKYLPLSPEMVDAIEISDRAEFGDVVDTTITASEIKQEEKQARKSQRLAAQLADEKPAEQESPVEEGGEAPEQAPAEDAQQSPPDDESQAAALVMPDPCPIDWITDYAASQSGLSLDDVTKAFKVKLPAAWGKLNRKAQELYFGKMADPAWLRSA